MTWELLALALFIAATGGVLVPAAALMKHQQLALRMARQPAATALENLDAKLVEAQRNLDEAKARLVDLAAQEVRRDRAVAEAEEASARFVDLLERLTLLEPKRLELEQLEQNLAARHEAMADVLQHTAEAEAKVEQYHRILKRVESDMKEMKDQAELARKMAGELPRLEAELQAKNIEKQQIESKLNDERRDLAEIQAKRESLHAEVLGLEHRKGELERTVSDLDANVQTAKKNQVAAEESALVDLKRPPACLSEARLARARGQLSEPQALEELKDYLNKLGLSFHERTLYAFHTCMKINDLSPLTVLAGISGTGKSELPRRYAEGMGIHFLQMAVQPRWDSPQDLFGFYNYLEHRYIATDLARALAHLDVYNHQDLANDWRDRMLLVLLDEMNLARVEYYFSEFLSRLEVRKSVNTDNAASRLDAEIQLDIGGREQAFNLYVDRNVLFVGTMNEDESTQTLSDKVIDRANVLRFGRPKRLADGQPRSDISRPDRFLSRQVWSSWSRSMDQLDMLNQQEMNQLGKWIVRLNDTMDSLERPFAHRINQAIRIYCVNYPQGGPDHLRHAFADQLEQRILPKLRGLDTAEFQDALGQLLALIEEIGDAPLAAAMQAGRQRPLFVWQGINRDT